MKKIGIKDIGIKTPIRKIKSEDIIKVWSNTPDVILKKNLGIYSRGVTDYDEDITTLSLESLNNMNKTYDFSKISGLFVGTTSEVDKLIPNSIILKQGIGLSDSIHFCDVKFSEKSGTLSLINALNLMSVKKFDSSLVLAADTLNINTAPGDLRESYMGAGAASLLLGTENIILEYIDSFSYTTYFPSNFRPYDERFIRTGLPLGGEKDEFGIIDHVKTAIDKLLELNNINKEDITSFVLPSFPDNIVDKIKKDMNIEDSQLKKTEIFKNNGFIGSASAIMELKDNLKYLDPNQLIILVGYGSGCSSDAILFKSTEEIKDYKFNMNTKKESIFVSYNELLKLENKIVQPNIKFGPFL